VQPAHATISEEAARLAELIPVSVLETLAQALANCDGAVTPSVASLSQCVPHAHYRALSIRFVDAWRSHADEVTPQAAAMALLAAARSMERRRAGESSELVWTGPDVGVIPVRLTEQALLQVVDAAEQRITVVSYAVYRIQRLCQGLLRAADRGCSIKIILETPDRHESAAAYDTIAALGRTILERAHIYVWPLEARPTDPKGRPGLMHVKAAVADGKRLLVSSANLTEHAFTTNMELGILVTGGELPGRVELHFETMIATGILVHV
jgi:cardiolipin synthase